MNSLKKVAKVEPNRSEKVKKLRSQTAEWVIRIDVGVIVRDES